MKKLLLATSLVGSVVAAQAQLLNVYDSTANYSGNFFAPGGATSQTSNTRMLFDDFSFAPIFSGKQVRTLAFTTINNNAAPVSFRARVRVFADDNGGAAPGTYQFGFSFALTQGASSASSWTADVSTTPGGVFMPSVGSKAWFGITFDSTTGTTAFPRASTTQINNLGWGMSTQGDAGGGRGQSGIASAFYSTSPTSGLFSNIAGSNLTFSGNPAPASNFSFGVQAVPEPATMAALGLGVAAMIRRRKK
jgi:hypothetical protein